MKNIIYILIPLSLLLTFSCTKPETHGSQSLTGVWKLDSLRILYIIKTPTGGSETDSIWRATGNIGTFEFLEDVVKYDYLTRNVQEKSTKNYTLRTFKEHSGFFKVRKWELSLPEKTYILEFGDQTSGAHIRAKKMTLISDPKAIGKQQMEFLFLSKL